MTECDHCGTDVENPMKACDGDGTYCDTACILADETGRPRSEFEYDGEIPDHDDLEVQE